MYAAVFSASTTSSNSGSAINNYCSVMGCVPSGIIFNTNVAPCSSPFFGNGCQNTPWFVLVLPYLEQATMANSFNFSIGIGGTASGLGSQRAHHQQHDPSDEDQFDRLPGATIRAALSMTSLPVPNPPTYSASKGNYAAHWGNTDFGQGIFDGVFNQSVHYKSAFGFNMNRSGLMLVTIASAIDGVEQLHFRE